jgi:hypothetical protein
MGDDDNSLGLGYNLLPKTDIEKELSKILSDNMSNLRTDMATSVGKDITDQAKNAITSPSIADEGGFFSDPKQMAGFGSLITAGAGLANTLAMMPILQEQRRSLEQNRKFAAEDQLARRTARNGFNSFRG